MIKILCPRGHLSPVHPGRIGGQQDHVERPADPALGDHLHIFIIVQEPVKPRVLEVLDLQNQARPPHLSTRGR